MGLQRSSADLQVLTGTYKPVSLVKESYIFVCWRKQPCRLHLLPCPAQGSTPALTAMQRGRNAPSEDFMF